jgi:NAD(P)-dependent dehydrogenase (short-subunit alcohol dehydrogenase family)
MDFDGKSVLIFGGSRGLGLVLARELAAEGARVTLAARDAEELDRAREDIEERGLGAGTVVCDIRQQRQVDAAIAQVAAERGGLDVLINDAGIIQVGPVEHMTVEDFQNALATHFWGPLYAMLAARPHLRQSPTARIVNISSIGGKIAVPHLLPYSASKFALTGLSEGLRAELAREGIRVTTVCPGLMRTGSTYNAWFKGKHRQEFAWFHVADSLPGLSTSATNAARQIVDACRYGDAELIITLPARLAVLANALVPGFTAAVMALTNRLLPSATDEEGASARPGWQSVSRVAPSRLTRFADRATIENNEVPAGVPG